MKNNQIEIVDKLPELKDQQINQFRDFKGLLNQYHDYRATLIRNRIVGSALSAIALLSIVAVYLYSREDTRETFRDALETTHSTTPNNVLVGPVPEYRFVRLELKDAQRSQIAEVVAPSVVSKEKAWQNTEKPFPNPVPDDRTTESGLSQFTEAAPVNGMDHLYTYLYESILYPEELRKDSVEGVVIVKFSVESDSSIAHVTIVQSLGEKFDQEAIRVIHNMPPWKPAFRNGIPLEQSFTIPVRFSMDKF